MSQAWLKSKRARCQEIIYGRCYLHGLLSNIPVIVTDWAACVAHKTHHTLPMHPSPRCSHEDAINRHRKKGRIHQMTPSAAPSQTSPNLHRCISPQQQVQCMMVTITHLTCTCLCTHSSFCYVFYKKEPNTRHVEAGRLRNKPKP